MPESIEHWYNRMPKHPDKQKKWLEDNVNRKMINNHHQDIWAILRNIRMGFKFNQLDLVRLKFAAKMAWRYANKF